MRYLAFSLVLVPALLGSAAALAQDAKNGERLSERWCVACHAIGTPTAKTSRTTPFAAIAEKPGMSSEMIASFLKLPHATMPNPPLRESDARDIAAFIMQMKK